MPTNPTPSAEVRLLETLKNLHQTTLDSFEELESSGATTVPISNVRQIVDSYMAIMLRLVSYFMVDRHAQDQSGRHSDGLPMPNALAVLTIGITIGGFLAAAIILSLD